jgi:hypothetical protein
VLDEPGSYVARNISSTEHQCKILTVIGLCCHCCRALQTINFREEVEKLNVWIAYLNLENVYGNPPKVWLIPEKTR